MLAFTIVLLFSFSILSIPTTASVVGGRRNRRGAVETYDRSVTTLDPSGRLLQVEYAHQATMRRDCGSVAAMILHDTLYIAFVRSGSSSSSAATETSPPLHRTLHRLDHHVWMIGTGLMGDVLFLARNLRHAAQETRSQRGEAWTAAQAATTLSAWHHQLTVTTGIRPLGVSCLVFGWDEPSAAACAGDETATPVGSAPSTPSLRLFQCSPGGVQQDCWYCTSGHGHEAMLQSLEDQYPQWCDSGMDEATLIAEFAAAVRNGCVKSAPVDTTETSANHVGMDICMIRCRQGQRSTTCLTGVSSNVERIRQSLSVIP